MKVIGLIGGMSWQSSKVYYELINEKIGELLGGYHSCKCLMYSVDFAEIEALQHQNNWTELNKLMVDAAQRLEKGGADLIVLCTNTMHLCSEAIISNTSIPFLHIAEATGEEIANKGLKKIGLLGTKFTMEKDFYSKILLNQFQIEAIIPNEKERNDIHNIIYDELVHGTILDASRNRYKEIIKNLESRGAEGIAMACTEIPLLLQQSDVALPLFNTTEIHSHKAVEWALMEDVDQKTQ